MKINIMNGAIADIRGIHRYIADNNSKDVATDVIHQIKQLIASLNELPNRGSCVRELENIGIQHYRELHHKPYRIIYSVDVDAIFVHVVIDSRRNIQSGLLRRLILS